MYNLSIKKLTGRSHNTMLVSDGERTKTLTELYYIFIFFRGRIYDENEP